MRAARERGLDVAGRHAFIALPGRGRRGDRRRPRAVGRRPAPGAERDSARLPPRGRPRPRRAARRAIVLGEGDRVLARVRPRRPAAARGRGRDRAPCARAGIGAWSCSPATPSASRRAVAARVGIDEWRAGLLPGTSSTRSASCSADGRGRDGRRRRQRRARARRRRRRHRHGRGRQRRRARVRRRRADGRRPRRACPTRSRRVAARCAIMRQNVVASLAVKAVFVVLAPLGLVTLVARRRRRHGHVAARHAQRAAAAAPILITSHPPRAARPSSRRARAVGGGRPAAPSAPRTRRSQRRSNRAPTCTPWSSTPSG